MIVGRRDTCTFPEIQLEAFESAAQPKKVIVHQGGHFQTYTAHFEETSTIARQWFVDHLAPSDESTRALRAEPPVSKPQPQYRMTDITSLESGSQ
jgi:hypothetical protein